MKRLLWQEGTAAVEFAIIFPLLIVLLCGLTEFGLLLFNQQVITNASREGARAGIVSQNPRVDDTAIQQIVDNYCSRLITFGEETTPATTITRTGLSFGDDLTVTVTFDYGFLIVPEFIPLVNPFQLTARTVMKYE